MLLAIPIKSVLGLFLAPVIAGFVIGMVLCRLVIVPERQHFSCVVPPHHYGVVR